MRSRLAKKQIGSIYAAEYTYTIGESRRLEREGEGEGERESEREREITEGES